MIYFTPILLSFLSTTDELIETKPFPCDATGKGETTGPARHSLPGPTHASPRVSGLAFTPDVNGAISKASNNNNRMLLEVKHTHTHTRTHTHTYTQIEMVT